MALAALGIAAAVVVGIGVGHGAARVAGRLRPTRVQVPPRNHVQLQCWMSNLFKQQQPASGRFAFRDRYLHQTIMPGSHNSATGRLKAGFFTNSVAQCQSLTIQQQLNLGVRALDLRLTPRGALAHGPVRCLASLKEVCADIVRFYKQPGCGDEVIVLSIGRQGSIPMTTWKGVAGTISAQLGDRVAPAGAHRTQTLWQLRGKVLVFTNCCPVPQQQQHQQKAWRPTHGSKIQCSYHVNGPCGTPSHVLRSVSSYSSVMARRPWHRSNPAARDPHLATCQVTLGLKETVLLAAAPASSLEHLARTTNSMLYRWLLVNGVRSKFRRSLNIVSYDFVVKELNQLIVVLNTVAD